MNRIVILYRFVLLANLLCYVAFWISPYLYEYFLSEAELQVIGYGSGINSMMHIPPWINWLGFALWGFSILGIYFFIRYSREFFVSVTIVLVIITYMSGVSVLASFEALLVELVAISDGAILVFIYAVPSISNKFYSR